MNKYKVHLCVIFILAAIISSVDAGSRKRYRKKKASQKDVNTNMNVNAYLNQKQPVKSPQPSKSAIPAEQPITGIPQLQNRMQIQPPAVQYDHPIEIPQMPAAVDKESLPIQVALPISQDAQDDEEESIELNFENADLQNFVKQIEDIFELTFISDDAVVTPQVAKKTVKNNKISFKTHKPLTKKETWNLFVTFLDIAGFAITPQADPKVFRITTMETARKSPLPTFIGVDYHILPDTDELIRYVYFLENASVDTMMEIVSPLRSSSSQGLIALREHKGFILTDKAYNIKTLMAIVKELDKISTPESMAVLKLRNADATQVRDLYLELIPKEDASSRFLTKKQPTSLYFPENTRIIADSRTNTLILLGNKNAIKKIENFIIKYIDVELDQSYSPLYTYQMKYAEASTIAEIMNTVTNYGRDTAAGHYGGVRGVDQYMRPITFIAQEATNRLIIKGHYDDYLKAMKIITQLDAKQPQAAIEVLILTVDLSDTKSLGAQIRSKKPGPNGLLGNNINFQTSGLYGTSPLVTNPTATTGAQRLLGNLVNLVIGSSAGTSFLTLGNDIFGVWGVFQALESITDTEVVANPFILATNNTKATVAIGEERRIITQEVVGGPTVQNAFDADKASLQVSITPQINSDGMINLAVDIRIDEFTNAIDKTDATANTRQIITNATVANKEVLALGGLIRENIQTIESKVPILGDIPILGWFFKNKQKINVKQSLLVLISTRIIESGKGPEMKAFTHNHIEEYQETIDYMESASTNRDPIHRLFFQDKVRRADNSVGGLIFERYAKNHPEESKVNVNPELVDPHGEDGHTPNPGEETTHLQTAKNDEAIAPISSLIQTVHNKKRTELSLEKFLQNKEAHT